MPDTASRSAASITSCRPIYLPLFRVRKASLPARLFRLKRSSRICRIAALAPWSFVLDACRDNPFKTGTTRSLGGARGLAQGTPPEGVFVLYSAGVGQSALDRMSDNDADPNSVFTRIFLKEIQKKDTPLVAIAKTTQVAVRDLSQTVSHTQVPAYYDQIIGQLYLASESAAPAKVDQNLPAAGNKQSKPPAIANVPVTVSSPPLARCSTIVPSMTISSEQPQYGPRRPNRANPNAIANCDRLASYGSDVPDSRAPRVAQTRHSRQGGRARLHRGHFAGARDAPTARSTRPGLAAIAKQDRQRGRPRHTARSGERRLPGGDVADRRFLLGGSVIKKDDRVAACSGFAVPQTRALVRPCRTSPISTRLEREFRRTASKRRAGSNARQLAAIPAECVTMRWFWIWVKLYLAIRSNQQNIF